MSSASNLRRCSSDYAGEGLFAFFLDSDFALMVQVVDQKEMKITRLISPQYVPYRFPPLSPHNLPLSPTLHVMKFTDFPSAKQPRSVGIASRLLDRARDEPILGEWMQGLVDVTARCKIYCQDGFSPMFTPQW